MPIYIGVCDDEEIQRRGLCRLILRWAEEKPLWVEILEYSSSEEFLFKFPEQPCDLLLLDIEMGGKSGMELARKLRENHNMLPLVFVTGFPEFMPEGYDVEALQYLLKPVEPAKLFSVLDKFISRHSPSHQLIISTEDGIIHISPEEIAYIEAMGKYTKITMSDGRKTESTDRFGEITGKLGDAFVLCHRSYCVNLRFVRSLLKSDLLLDSGEKIPVSRRAYRKTNEKFIKYYNRGCNNE